MVGSLFSTYSRLTKRWTRLDFPTADSPILYMLVITTLDLAILTLPSKTSLTCLGFPTAAGIFVFV